MIVGAKWTLSPSAQRDSGCEHVPLDALLALSECPPQLPMVEAGLRRLTRGSRDRIQEGDGPTSSPFSGAGMREGLPQRWHLSPVPRMLSYLCGTRVGARIAALNRSSGVGH